MAADIAFFVFYINEGINHFFLSDFKSKLKKVSETNTKRPVEFRVVQQLLHRTFQILEPISI